MTLYTESVADQTYHLGDALVRRSILYGYDDVMTV